MANRITALLSKGQGSCSFLLPSKKPFSSFASQLGTTNYYDPRGSLDDALYSFREMLQRRPLPPSYSFTPLLNAITQLQCFSTCIDCFKQMCAVGVPVNKRTACVVITCYCQSYQTQHGLTVLGCCLKHGVIPDHTWTWTYNTLIRGFILEDKTHEAESLFKNLIKNHVCEPNLFTYNTMITGLCKIGDNFTAIALVRLMDARGCKPNLDTYNTIIDSLCNDLMLYDAFKLFKGMIFHCSPAPPNVVTYNSLINALCKSGHWDEVSRMMKQMEVQRISPDIKTFNAIVDALCKQGYIKAAETVIDIMYDNFDIDVDTTTVNSLINGHCLRGELTKAKAHYNNLGCRRGIDRNVDTYNIMIDGYFRALKPLEASLFYNDLRLNCANPKPNMVAHNIVYMQLTTCETLSEHEELQFKLLAYQSLLTRLVSGNAYEDALALFRFMDSNGKQLNSHTEVYKILIDGAIKCGKFDAARRLFHDLLFVEGLEPDVSTYKIMISGFEQRGLHKDAKKMLFEMEKSTAIEKLLFCGLQELISLIEH